MTKERGFTIKWGPPLLVLSLQCLVSPLAALNPVSSFASSLQPVGGPLGASLSEGPRGGASVAPWAPYGVSRVLGGFMQLGSSKEDSYEGEDQSESQAEEGASQRAPKGKRAPSEEDEEEGSQMEEEEGGEGPPKPRRGAAAAAAAGEEKEEWGEGASKREAEAGEAAPPMEVPAVPGPVPGAPLPPLPPMSEFLPQLSYADGDELCHSVSCNKVLFGASSKLPIKGNTT